MFLQGLDIKQKHLFLQLAKKAIDIDGKQTSEELNLLKEYLREMELPEDTKIEEVDYSLLLKEINDACDMICKKKIMFEIIAIEMVDADFADVEKEFVVELGNELGIERDDINLACNVVDSMYSTYFFLYEYLRD